MRIPFRNMGHAQITLKACLGYLDDEFEEDSPDVHLPSQRLRNAFCIGLGYSSYSELQKLMKPPLGNAWKEPTEGDFSAAIVKGFKLAMHILVEDGLIAPHNEEASVVFGGEVVDQLNWVMLPIASAARQESRGLVRMGEYLSGKTDHIGPEKLNFILKTAEWEFSDAVALDPQRLEAHHALANIAFEEEDFEKSRRLSEKALSVAVGVLKNDAPEALDWSSEGPAWSYLGIRQTLGFSLLKLGRFDDARREFTEILKRDKTDKFGVQQILNQTVAA